jgi:hypothetical protein
MDIQKLTCTIADDSIFSRKILHNICQELNLSVVKEYASGDELLADLDTTKLP